jgi:hypothetical protein
MPLPGPRFASATVVEDGAGKADSNTYVGVHDVDPERVPDEVLQAVIETALNLATDDRVRAGGETRWSQIAVAGAVTLIAESDKGTASEAKALMPLHARRLVSRFGDLLEPIGSVRSRKLNRA